MAPWMGEPPPVANVRHVAIPSADGVAMARVFYPATRKALPVLVFFHGGGWVSCAESTVCSLILTRVGVRTR
jgi:acetyl esterase/lipase